MRENQVQPITVGGTTLVQVRPLFEAMGLEVKWDKTSGVSSDGTFKSTDLILASLDATDTLVLTYADGTVVRSLFFDHAPGSKNSLKNIQIGKNNFYISEDQ
ncbi:stalk domain-containing protein [Paenibacillus macerans]|uniref:stalk domain-containing protein n=1 Tax=Paenibacillus TaxID=44249 RepID=UPI0035A2228D